MSATRPDLTRTDDRRVALPATMKAVLLRAYDGKPESVEVAEVAVPEPGAAKCWFELQPSC